MPDTLIPDNITLDGGILYNLRSGAILANPTLSANRGLTIGPAGGSLNVNNSGQAMTLLGPVAGAGTLNKIGAGRAALAGESTNFTGKIVVTGGILACGVNGGELGDNPAAFVPDSITLDGGALGNNANGFLVNWSVPVNRGILIGANGGGFAAESTSGNVTIWAESVITGAGSLRKSGGGALVLNTANTYTGGTFVTNGSPITSDRAAIILGDPAGLGTGTLFFVNSNSLSGLRYAGTSNAVVGNNIVLSGTNYATNRWLVDVDTPVTFSGVLSGGHATSTLIKDGPGTLFLPAVNTLSSTGLVARGALYGVTGGACSNLPIILAANNDTAILGVRITDNTRQWTCPSLVCDNGGAFGPTLEFLFNTDGSTTIAPLNVTGQVAFNATTTVRVFAANLRPTTGDGYPLMTWGSVTGTPPEDWNLQLEPSAWVTGTLKTIGNTLYLQITSSAEPLRWAAGNGVWDTTTFPANWMNSATPPSISIFGNGDAVQFEDTQNTGGGIISLDGTVIPASVLVNSANNYTFTSTGSSVIAGFGPLVKSGPGTLTIAGLDGNTFSGGVTVNQGTLVAAKPPGTEYGACGSGNVVVNSGARIVADGNDSLGGVLAPAGRSLTINAGGVITNTGTSSGPLSRVFLNGGVLGASTANPTSASWGLRGGVATLGNSNVSTIVGGNLALSQPGGTVFNILTGDSVNVFADLANTPQAPDFGLLKNGNGTLNLYGSCTSTGAVTLNAGTLRLGNQALPRGLFSLATSTIASTDAGARTITNTLFSGIASSVFTFGDAIGTGPLTFTGPLSFASGSTGRGMVTTTDVEFTGPITGGNGVLNKSGNAALILSGLVTVTWTNGWKINAGSFIVNGTLITTSTVTVASSARLGGRGTIGGPIVLSPGATLAPGTSIGTLTLSNAPTWAGATVLMELNQTNAQTADKLVRANGGFSFSGAALVVTNLGPALTNGTFTLFSTGNSGEFASTQLPPLDPSLAWDLSTLAANGTLKIIPSKPTSPTNVTWSFGGNQLTLNWPANYLGWTLQVQTNSLNVGLSSNWVDVPGTAAVTSYSVTVDPASPVVFYRLRY